MAAYSASPLRLAPWDIGPMIPKDHLMKAAPSMSKQSARKIMKKAATKVIRASQIIFNARVEMS